MSAILLGFGCMIAAGEVIYVNADAPGGGNGQTWDKAYKYLQDALYKPPTRGDEIWVAEGTYKPDQDEGGNVTPGERTETFELTNGVAIYGGFDNTGDPVWGDRDPNAYETILSGDLDDNDVPVTDPCDLLTEPTRSKNSYHVVTGSLTDSTAVLDGFTIMAGNANAPGMPHDAGGGMRNASGYPTVSNCTFTGNSAIWGGGIENLESSPAITNCTFIENFAHHGGGVNTYNSNMSLTNCTFSGNSAAWGGGMRNRSNGIPTITNCKFSGNSASMLGGGMCNSANSNPTVSNCTFSGNSADSYGGGIYNDGSNPILTNCTFSGNQGYYSGGGMYNSTSSNPELVKCTFSENFSSIADGAGMYNSGSNPILTNCTFKGNQCYFSGGGMFNNQSHPTITFCNFRANSAGDTGGGMRNHDGSAPTLIGCTFTENVAVAYGGAMWNNGSSPTVFNCSFDDNSAETSNGGGIGNFNGSNPIFTNCIFHRNSSQYNGGGIYDKSSSSPTLTSCIVWGNTPDQIFDYDSTSTPTLSFSDVQGGWPDANSTNIDADPLFVDPNNPDPNLRNLRLKWDSPCIDAGNSTILMAASVLFDLDGKDRYVDIDSIANTGSGLWGYVDMGAYEFYCNGIAGDINCDGVVDFKDLAILCGNWLAGTEPEL